MQKIIILITALFIHLCIIFTFQPAFAEQSSICENITDAIEVQKGVYVRQGQHGVIFKDKDIANIGFIVGEKAIAVIDTGGSIREGERLICQIKKVSNLPIQFVINTHVHPDHTMGNAAFDKFNATFIGHKNLPHAMNVLSKTYLRRYNEQSSENISESSIILPQTLVSDTLEIDLGNRLITLIAARKAHTNNDLLVYDKKTDTLWLSDLLFHQHIPVMGKSGSVNGWLEALNILAKRGVNHVIPGHGSLKMNGNKAVKDEASYLTLLRDEIRKNISTDEDLTKAMASIGIEEESKWRMFSIFHKRNISYIFSELEWE